jgi:hypothetical protein
MALTGSAPVADTKSTDQQARFRAVWSDRGVKTKVLAAVSVTALVAVLVGVLGLQALGRSAESNRTLYQVHLASVAAGGDMRAALSDLRINLRNAALATSRDSAQKYLDTLPDITKRFEAATTSYPAAALTPEKQALLKEAATAYADYIKLVASDLGPLILAGDTAGYVATNDSKVLPLAQLTQKDVDALRTMEMSAAASAATVAQDDYLSQRSTAIVSLVAGIALAVAVGLVVASGIARGVGRVKVVSDALAIGDLTKSSGLRSRDELGLMGASLDEAVDNLRKLMMSVASSADAEI